MKTIKIIDLLVKITYGLSVPDRVSYGGFIWSYEPHFGQYKNHKAQDLIRYMHGDYNEAHCGLIYPAIFDSEVWIVEDEHDN